MPPVEETNATAKRDDMRKRAKKNGAPPYDPTRKRDEGTERNDPTGETPNETRNGKRRKVIHPQRVEHDERRNDGGGGNENDGMGSRLKTGREYMKWQGI